MTTTAGDHAGEDGADGIHAPEVVDPHLLLELLGGHLEEAPREGDPGHADEDVARTLAGLQLGDRGRDLVLITDVSSSPRSAFELSGLLLQRLRITGDE